MLFRYTKSKYRKIPGRKKQILAGNILCITETGNKILKEIRRESDSL